MRYSVDPRGLTGRTRHRVHKPWLGPPVMVLQVEENVRLWDYTPSGAEHTLATRWRDARPQDVTVRTDQLTKPEEGIT